MDKLLESALHSAEYVMEDTMLAEYDLRKEATKKGLVPVGANNWAYLKKTTGKKNERGFFELKDGEYADFKTIDGRFTQIDKDGNPTGPTAAPAAPEPTQDGPNKPTPRPTGARSLAQVPNSPRLKSMMTSMGKKIAHDEDKLSPSQRNKLKALLSTIGEVEQRISSHNPKMIKKGVEDLYDALDKYAIRITPTSQPIITIDGIGKLPTGLRNTLNTKAFRSILADTGVELNSTLTETGELAWKDTVGPAAKPDLGKAFKPEDDKTVDAIFKSSVYLEKLNDKHKGVFGVEDDGGNFVRSGGKNSKKYLAHSIEADTSVDSIIGALEDHQTQLNRHRIELGSAVHSSIEDSIPEAVDILQNYKERMNEIASNLDSINPEEAISSAYAEFATELAMTNKALAGTVIKGFAEQHMYRMSLARGQEVYLPSSNGFPGGDIILMNRDEKVGDVSLVQVKYGGKVGIHSGFKTDTAQYMRYSSNESYRDAMVYEVGTEGYELGVKSEMITDASEFERVIADAGISEAVTDPERLQSALALMVKHMSDERSTQFGPDFQNSKVLGNAFQRKLLKKDAKWASEQIRGSLDMSKLNDEWGESNVRHIFEHKANSPTYIFINALMFAGALKTSNGIDTVSHNAHFIDGDEFRSAEYHGSPKMSDWELEYSTSGHSSGTLRAGPKIPKNID